MGHWEALAADTRLGLESKLEAAAVEKRGKSYQPPEELRDLPKGESVLVSRCQLRLSPPHSIYLLRLPISSWQLSAGIQLALLRQESVCRRGTVWQMHVLKPCCRCRQARSWRRARWAC